MRKIKWLRVLKLVFLPFWMIPWALYHTIRGLSIEVWEYVTNSEDERTYEVQHNDYLRDLEEYKALRRRIHARSEGEGNDD
jgi:hypothetical protein